MQRAYFAVYSQPIEYIRWSHLPIARPALTTEHGHACCAMPTMRTSPNRLLYKMATPAMLLPHLPWFCLLWFCLLYMVDAARAGPIHSGRATPSPNPNPNPDPTPNPNPNQVLFEQFLFTAEGELAACAAVTCLCIDPVRGRTTPNPDPDPDSNSNSNPS